uniref:Sarcalumenin n=1 Tax=Megaselia scalaris TaxID=36166 RepID=T1GAQ1_MEGSC
MSSAQPPAMYTTSLWSHPYESGAPVRLLRGGGILMWGNKTEVLDGTQLAADYTFSGLQKFGQGLEDRLRGLKLPSKLLEKVNIVEIPGILEVRKQVQRLFPFNDACQWFIDRADMIVLMYDPAKLDADEIIDNPQNYHIYEGLSTLTNISRYDLPDPEVYRDFFRLNPLFEFKKLSDTCTYFGGCPITKLDTAIAYDLPELVGKYKKMAESAVAAVDKKYESLQKDAEKGSS